MPKVALTSLIEKFHELPLYAQQSIIGSAGGVMTGYTLAKFGKSAGFSLGASIMLLQIGVKLGYIKIDWNSVERDIQRAKEEVEKQASTHIPDISNQTKKIINENMLTVSSFVGGFFVGFRLA